VLDVGDDCHERNLVDRAAELGGGVFVDCAAPLQMIDHHKWQRSPLWTRFTHHTNIFRWDAMKQLIEGGEYPLRAPNDFDLSRGGGGGGQVLADLRVVAPLNGATVGGGVLRVEVAYLGAA
jgi:hypothetical protein